jgi:phosphonate transport system substrate-binding protein
MKGYEESMLRNLKRLGRISLWAWLALAGPYAHAAPDTLDMGVFPYMSTRALLDLYQPVRVYLSHELGKSVTLFTAQSFKAFTNETQQGIYDIVVTAPHFARLAQREAGYVPLITHTRELSGLVVVPVDSPIHNLRELKGKRIATPNQLALVTIMGYQLLRDDGLEPGTGVTLIDMTSHNNAVLAALSGEADAAITEQVALMQMPADIRNRVRIIAHTSPLPHVMYLAHRRLGQARIAQIKGALLRFPRTAAGQTFLKVSGFEGMRPVEEDDLKNMDRYLPELERLLAARP